MHCWTESAENRRGQSINGGLSAGASPSFAFPLAFVLICFGFAAPLPAQTTAGTSSVQAVRDVQANPTFPQAAPTNAPDRSELTPNAFPASNGASENTLKTPIHRPEAGSPEHVESGTTGDAVWTTLGLLCLLLTGLYAVLLLVRRFGTGRFTTAEREHIQLVARQRLDAQATVYLLRVGRRVIVAAGSPGGFTALSEISDPDEVAELCHEPGSEADGQSLRSLFSTAGAIRGESNPPASPAIDSKQPATAAVADPTASRTRQEAWHA